jgi:hypothetical protein
MAEANKTSFLGSLSSWSRSTTPPPKSPLQPSKDENLKQIPAIADHSISLRPSPSLRRYPRDCPSLRAKWFYAVDVPKRKPFSPEQQPDDKTKPLPVPKKFVPFSASDSQAIETAFQSLDKNDVTPDDSSDPTSTKVPVNEDYLFDVHIEKRELEPAYWLGPVYEVKRGSWFYQEGPYLRPCDENLANQLEEGFLKTAPWRQTGSLAARSASQPRTRPTSLVVEKDAAQKASGTATPNDTQTTAPSLSNSYRLFGTHMNTTVTFMDSTTAYLAQDDFMSRVSSTVYERFGAFGGTKVVRGWSDPGKTVVESKSIDTKEKSISTKVEPEKSEEDQENDQASVGPPKRTALERQFSSLAGLGGNSEDSKNLDAEEAQAEQQREMEDAREKEGDDQRRQIDHLVLVTHGIGQRLGIRLDSINFIHDVNTMRKTMKGVYESAPDLQAISGDPKNSKIQVLPICWRHLLEPGRT